jgi:hypothetical protein
MLRRLALLAIILAVACIGAPSAMSLAAPPSRTVPSGTIAASRSAPRDSPQNNVWTDVGWSPFAERSAASMAYSPTAATIVLFGGMDVSGNALGDTWTWDGAAWTQQHPSVSPPARDFASMAYDPVSGVVLLFGGRGGNGYLNDTWTWDGATWTKRSPATSPAARWQAAMASDGKQIVLFGGATSDSSCGGYGFNGKCDDTWIWDGVTWALQHPDRSPNPRDLAGMAGGGGQVVLFGGCCDYGGNNVSEAWTWDGSAWTMRCIADCGPAPCGGTGQPGCLTARRNPAMAYDDAAGAVVLFGGFSSSVGNLTDTWTWDGSGWTQQHPSVSPSADDWSSMAYDTAADEVVLLAADYGTWTWGPPPPVPASITLGRTAGSTLSINQKSTLSGYVNDANGKPVPRAQVTLTTQQGTVDSPVTTGSDGSFNAGFTPSVVGQVSVSAAVGQNITTSAQFNVVNGIEFGLTNVNPMQITSGETPAIKVAGFGLDPTSPASVYLNGTLAPGPVTVIDNSDLTFTAPSNLGLGSYEVKVTQAGGASGRLPNALQVVSSTGETTMNLFGMQITYQGQQKDASGDTVYAGPIYIGGNPNDAQNPIGSEGNPATLTYSGTIILHPDGSSTWQGPVDDPSNATLSASTPLGPLQLWSGSFSTPASGVVSFLSGNSALSLAGFSVKLTQLTVNGNTVTLAGTIGLPGGASISVNNFTIDPANGVVGSATVNNLSILGVGISGSITFDQPNNHFAGQGNISVPWGTLGGGGVGLWNGGLQSADITAGLNPAIALGPTGIFLNSVTGGGTGFVQPPVTFDLSGNFSWPTPGTGILNGNIGATLVIGRSFVLAGDVNLSVLDAQIPLAAAQIGIYTDHMHAGASLNLGPFSGDLSITFYYDGSFDGSGQAQVCVPFLGCAAAGIHISNSGVSPYIFRPDREPRAVQTSTPAEVITATVPGPLGVPYQVMLDSQGTSHATPEWPAPAGATTWQPTTLSNSGPALTMTLPAGLPQAAIGAGWQSGSSDVTLVDPNGQTYTPQANAGIYANPSGANEAFYLIQSPPAGAWSIQVSTSAPSSLGTVSPVLLAPASAPSLSLGAVTLSNGVATVPYSASSFSGQSGVNLYYNATNSTAGGILITHNLPIGQSQSYQWTLPASLPSGSYYTYGTLDDGLHDPVAVPGLQPFTWTNPNMPLAPQGLAVSAHNGVLNASWQPVAGAAGYALSLLDSSGKTLVSNGIGNVTAYTLDPASGIWTGLATGSSYQLQVATVLPSGLASTPSTAVAATLPAPNFPALSNLQWSASSTTGAGAVVVSGSAGNAANLTVTDNGTLRVGPVAPSSGSFTLLVPLYPGPNALALTATSSSGDTQIVATSLSYAATPPALVLTGPAWKGSTTNSPSLTVTGTTNPGDSVRANGALASVDAAGSFSVAIGLVIGANPITILATNSLGQTSSDSGTIVYTPPPAVSATASLLAANWTAAPADGSFVTTLTVTLNDAAGNSVSGRGVSLTQGSGHSTITTVSGTTNSQGQASFSVTDATAETVTYTAKDTSDGLPLNQTAEVAFDPRGDVNLDGAVTSVDALCVLRDVAQLPTTGACPQTAATQAAAHVNGDPAAVTSVDALCVLRIVAALPATGACPQAGQTASHAAETAAAGPTHASVSLSLSPLDAKLAKGKQTTITLRANATGSGLGAWTVDLGYDPSTLTVVRCAADAGAVCNPAYKAGIVRISGASASGLSGSQTLATLVIEGTGRGRTDGGITISAAMLAAPDGQTLAVAVAAGATAGPSSGSPTPDPSSLVSPTPQPPPSRGRASAAGDQGSTGASR